MKISNSSIFMSAQSQKSESYSKEEFLRVWSDNKRLELENREQSIKHTLKFSLDILEISEEALARQTQNASTEKIEAEDQDVLQLSDEDKAKITLIQRLLEKLTGKKIKFIIPEKIHLKDDSVQLKLPDSSQVRLQPQRVGWGLSYDFHESYYETQQMSFSSQGIVRTADGREINFSLQLGMSREFAVSQNISLRAGDAKLQDPLVINFDGGLAGLTNTKYQFDIDLDGNADKISFVAPGSGFLALDKNGDGGINDGSELFGPESGNGFSELSQYDSDGNQWIDENDDIYSRLRIWTKDGNGNDRLFALGQKGIGAIYLGSVASPFDFKDSSNTLQGTVQKTGIFLREDGSAGTVQHIDLAI